MMAFQWPWVSRSRLDAMQAQRDHWADQCGQAWVRESELAKVHREFVQHVADLSAKALESKLPVVVPPREIDVVTRAISARAGANGPLRTHLAHEAARMRAEGQEPDVIARQMTDWAWRPGQGTDSDRKEAEAHLEHVLDMLG